MKASNSKEIVRRINNEIECAKRYRTAFENFNDVENKLKGTMTNTQKQNMLAVATAAYDARVVAQGLVEEAWMAEVPLPPYDKPST